VLDSILFEKQGVPAVAVITDPFKDTAQAMAEAWGVPKFRYLSVPHPIANLALEELDRRAKEIVPELVELLLKGQK